MNQETGQTHFSDGVGRSVPTTPSQLYAAMSNGSPPLRVALVTPPKGPIWLTRFIDLAAESGWVDLFVLPVIRDESQHTIADLPGDMRAYLAFDRLRRRGHAPDSVTIDRRDSVMQESETQDGADPEELRTRVAALRPDLVMIFGAPSCAHALASLARWGCWSMAANLVDARYAGMSLLGPVLAGEHATAMELELDCGDPQPLSLVTSWGATWPGAFSLQRDQAFLKLPSLLMRVLRRLANGDIEVPRWRPAQLRLAPSRIPLGFGAGMRALAIALRYTARWQLEKRRGEDPWILLLRHGPEPLDPVAPTLGSNSVLAARGDGYWADPCTVEYAGRRLLFAEEYASRIKKAVIVCLELLPDGRAQRLGIALEEAFHLSYPQAFEWEGQWYLTVESGAARRVSLYRACAFPLRWERLTDLVRGHVAVDPTLHRHGRHWYLFVNVSESGGGTCDELFLFVADVLTGPFRPHPLNPIVSDVRRARPAGRLFNHGARLIRPGQDCASSYGAAIVFNEVLELSPTGYRERPLSRLDPGEVPTLNGCHTYSAVNEVEVLDARGQASGEMVKLDVANAPVDPRRCFASPPVVSVIIVACNDAGVLGQAMDSALDQTFGDLEVIVVNDGSDDGTGALADLYAASHPGRVRVLHQDSLGLTLARNAAIAVARGRYLALLGVDAVWLPDHIEACVTLLEADAGLGLVHAGVQYIDNAGHPLAKSPFERWTGADRDTHRGLLLWQQHVAGSTAVFRRSTIDVLGPFDASFNRLGCDDRDLWLRIAEAADVAYIDQAHARERIHDDNTFTVRNPPWRVRQLLTDKHVARPKGRPLRRRALAAIDAQRGHELAITAALFPALAAFGRAIARDPTRVDAWDGLFRRIFLGRRLNGVLPR